MADVCQKIGGATRRTVYVNRYFMNHQLWCRWFQTVRMEQCHAPELPCNYIDPLLKSACLQVNTVHCSGEQDKQFYFQPHGVFHSMNGQEKPTTKYVFTFYRQFKRKMRNFQCKQLIWGDSAWECFYTFFCFSEVQLCPLTCVHIWGEDPQILNIAFHMKPL